MFKRQIFIVAWLLLGVLTVTAAVMVLSNAPAANAASKTNDGG